MKIINKKEMNFISGGNVSLNQLTTGYKPSPAAIYAVEQATIAANNAAAAGGYFGSPQHQVQLDEQIINIASLDYNQYLYNILMLGKSGISGK